MPIYVVLGRFTDEGAKDIKSWPQIAAQNRARAEQLGMKLHGWYMTQGEYDFVVIAEAPDDETMLVQNLGSAGTGRSRSETLRAYPLEEVKQAIQKLG